MIHNTSSIRSPKKLAEIIERRAVAGAISVWIGPAGELVMLNAHQPLAMAFAKKSTRGRLARWFVGTFRAPTLTHEIAAALERHARWLGPGVRWAG